MKRPTLGMQAKNRQRAPHPAIGQALRRMMLEQKAGYSQHATPSNQRLLRKWPYPFSSKPPFNSSILASNLAILFVESESLLSFSAMVFFNPSNSFFNEPYPFLSSSTSAVLEDIIFSLSPRYSSSLAVLSSRSHPLSQLPTTPP